MKTSKWQGLAAAVALSAAASCAAITPAITPASAAVSVVPHVHEVFTTTGQVHPFEHNNWCLTSVDNPSDRSEVWWAPCLPKSAWQEWFAYRVVDPTKKVFNVGAISLAAHPDFSIGQTGVTDKHVRTLDVLHHPAEEIKTVLYFHEWRDSKWTVSVPHFHHYFLSGTNRLIAGHFYTAFWLKGNATQIQFVIFQHAWKRLDEAVNLLQCPFCGIVR
jgi:hypothetical protein